MKTCSCCGYDKLNGVENICPKCNSKLIYKCKKCGKELYDGKKNMCPLCAWRARRLIGIILSIFGGTTITPGIIVGGLYFFNPMDFVPDFTPVGFIDDLILVLGIVLISGGSLISGIIFLITGIIFVKKLSEKNSKIKPKVI